MSRFSLSVLRCFGGDDRGVDDLAAHRQKSGRRQRRIEAPEQNLDRRLAGQPRPRQRFAEGPDRVGIRHRVGQTQAEKAHERQPVADQVFGPLVRQIVAGLQDQRLEHHHVIEGGPSAFRAVRARHGALQIRPKQFEINHRAQPLQAVALGRELLQPLINIEKPRLTAHLRPPAQTPTYRITNRSKSRGFWRSPTGRSQIGENPLLRPLRKH